jgi:hypothetical protein
VSCIAAIYKNGIEVARGNELNVTGNGSNGRNQNVVDTVFCRQGDYLELYAYTSVNFSLGVGLTQLNYMSVTLLTASQGPQGPPGPGPGGSVQRNAGKSTNYNTISASGNILDGSVAGAGNPLILTVTPTVPSWWEINFNLSNLLALTAAYYYTQLQMNLSPGDLDGLTSVNGVIITQHSQVQQYEGRTFQRIFRLAAGQAYTITPSLNLQGGSFQYYTGAPWLWIEGKLWPQ